VLAVGFPETAESHPELLAHHYTEAGLIDQAVNYWYTAGERAIERSAFTEARSHLNRGLEELQILPKTRKRDEDELLLLMGLIIAVQTTKGLSSLEAEQALNQAYTLCQQVGDPEQQIKILLGLRLVRHLRGDLQTAWEIGQQLLGLIDGLDEPELKVQVHYALGHTSYYLGAFETARWHLERGIQLYNTLLQRTVSVQTGLVDFLGSCYPPLAWSLWHAGYPDQSRSCIEEGLGFIDKQMNITGIEYLLSSAAIVYQCCGQGRLALEHIERALTIATEQGFQFRRAWNLILMGWIVGEQGQIPDGIEIMSHGLDDYRTTGAQVSTPWFLALFSEMHGRAEQVDHGLVLMAQAIAMMSETGQRFYHAELHRLRGGLLLIQSSDNDNEAEVCFHQAIDIAQNQQAKSLELRAATSLARLWQAQGKRQAAYEVLAPVYGWYTEGFDTADLKDAKALLDALRP
jgi:tetratricopeptide (TPR) repeat protein